MAVLSRLYTDHPLAQGHNIPLERDQAHYLFGVMRRKLGDEVELFNGRDGEWRGKVVHANKHRGILEVTHQTRPLQMPPDLWLMFAPIKKARTDFIVEKATEMGAGRIVPVMTEYTNSDRVRQEKMQIHAVEAAEQCGGTYVPEVAELQKLDRLLDDWPDGRQLLFCDEGLIGRPTGLDQSKLTAVNKTGPWAILIGPEGGFSEKERNRLASLDFVTTQSLGPRILRADTAAVAALTLWQRELGDWK